MCRVPGQPFAPQSEGRWPALSLGFLFLTGAALVGLSSAVPGREELLPTIACVVAALVTGAILVAWGRPLALGALAGVLGLGAVLITVVIAASGRPAALDAVLYVWVTAYAGYFFPRRWLAATVAVIGLLYVAALTSAATADRAQHFLLVVGGAAGAGVFVALLRAQADRLVDQRLEAARTDALTGLPNRTQLAVRTGTALARARRTGTGVALLLVDLDEFKLVNDALGHAAGDELLRQAGARLHGTVRDTDTVARLGGDEFAVLLEPVDDADGAAEAAERTVAALCAGFDLGDETVQLPCSIGIALAGPGHDLERLLRDADLAMYAAKARGGGYAFFEDAMHQEVRRRRELTRDMQAAADREELVLDFQPIVDLRRETVVAVEALVRWEHPQHGLLAPDAFIPLAEQSGAIVELGRWVLADACRAAASWPHGADGTEPPTVSVNLSPRQLLDATLATSVGDALRASGLPAHRLMLEITETVVMSDPETAIRRLDDLRLLGVRLAVDDFGTGHSSLAYLRRLPVQELKLARQFVSDLDRTPESLALARGIVGLAHAMGMRVIAEGVEQPAERDRLRGMGCDLAQGYLFARPVRADALAPLLLAGARERRIPPDTADTADGRRAAATTGTSGFEDLRARYQAVLAQLPELVVMAFDTELRWRSVEGQALERLGWQAAELQGRHPREVLPAEHAHRLEALLRAALRGERRTTTWTTARGAAPFRVDLRPLRDSAGAVSGVVLVGRDRRAQAGG